MGKVEERESSNKEVKSSTVRIWEKLKKKKAIIRELKYHRQDMGKVEEKESSNKEAKSIIISI